MLKTLSWPGSTGPTHCLPCFWAVCWWRGMPSTTQALTLSTTSRCLIPKIISLTLTSGLIAAGLVFLLFCMLQFDDDKYFWRPHPAFWRLIKGLAILYLFFLVFLLFQVWILSPQPHSFRVLTMLVGFISLSIRIWENHYLNEVMPMTVEFSLQSPTSHNLKTSTWIILWKLQNSIL